MEPEGSLPHSQVSTTCHIYRSISPGLRHVCMFCDHASFYGEELLAPCPTPKTTPCQLSATAYSMYL